MDYNVQWRYYGLYKNGTQSEMQIVPESIKNELLELLLKKTQEVEPEITSVSLEKLEAPMWYNVVPNPK
jgi:hypothetical protein